MIILNFVKRVFKGLSHSTPSPRGRYGLGVVLWLFGLCMCGHESEGGILFRLSKPGMTSPSYLMGSMHVVKGEFVHQIPGFDDIYASVKRLCIETDIDGSLQSLQDGSERAKQLMESLQKAQLEVNALTSQLKLPIDSNYTMLLGPEKKKELEDALISLLPAGTPANALDINMLHPVLLINTMDVLLQSKFVKEDLSDSNQILDYYLYHKAKADSKQLAFLEPVALQDSIMVMSQVNKARELVQGASRPLLVQMEDVLAKCRKMPQTVEHYANVTENYKKGLSDKVLEFISDSSTPESMGLRYRNPAWMTQLPTLLTEQPTLVVVGLAHMFPFRDIPGLLSDMRKEGFTIEKVY